MNPGIFYLYEYSNSRKLRNAGYLKITRYYHSCTLQLNARGIPVSYADTVKFYVFYPENNLTETAVLTEITCANHALSARMTSPESQFPGGRTLDKVDGFFLPLPNGHILAAAAPGIAIDVQKLLSASNGSASSENASENIPDNTEAQMEIPDDTETQQEISDTDILQEQEETTDRLSTEDKAVNERQDTETTVQPEGKPIPESNIDEPVISSSSYEDEETCAEQTPSPGSDSRAAMIPATPVEQAPSCEENTPAEQIPRAKPDSAAEQSVSVQPDSSMEQNTPSESDSSTEQNTPSKSGSSAEQCASPQQEVRKIQRSELSALPRKYWHLANNSFLLHGYHNYNHLILIEKDGHYWLGVPGIYDPREARAARLFGFPQFTDSYNKLLQLSEDECNPQGNFGYWCCYLK